MHTSRGPQEIVRFDLSEGGGVWGCHETDEPRIARYSLALGGVVGVVLATGVWVLPPLDWVAAFVVGLVFAVFTRGLLLVARHLARGGWHSWRRRAANETVVERIAVGCGVALAFLLATGGGGVGPAFGPIEASIAGLGVGLLTRGLLAFARWP